MGVVLLTDAHRDDSVMSRDIETFWKKQNASLRHDLATSRKSEMKLKRELEKIQDRRSHERKEIKSMREALRVMREEARNHEKVTIDLEKKHEGEMRMMVEENIDWRWTRVARMDEVLRKVKRITMVDEDCGERNGTSGDANEYKISS